MDEPAVQRSASLAIHSPSVLRLPPSAVVGVLDSGHVAMCSARIAGDKLTAWSDRRRFAVTTLRQTAAAALWRPALRRRPDGRCKRLHAPALGWQSRWMDMDTVEWTGR